MAAQRRGVIRMVAVHAGGANRPLVLPQVDGSFGNT